MGDGHKFFDELVDAMTRPMTAEEIARAGTGRLSLVEDLARAGRIGACSRPLRGSDRAATGTDAGWQRHRRAGETPCDPCVLAHRAHTSRIQREHPDAHREANARWRVRNDTYFAEWRADHPLYDTWRNMVRRCYDPQHVGFARWGGRGIRVCDEWRESIDAFAHDMGPKPSPQHSLDCIDNDGDYEPGNCRWATPAEQRENRRDVVRAGLT